MRYKIGKWKYIVTNGLCKISLYRLGTIEIHDYFTDSLKPF